MLDKIKLLLLGRLILHKTLVLTILKSLVTFVDLRIASERNQTFYGQHISPAAGNFFIVVIPPPAFPVLGFITG